jgi:hypothetical protein
LPVDLPGDVRATDQADVEFHGLTSRAASKLACPINPNWLSLQVIGLPISYPAAWRRPWLRGEVSTSVGTAEAR